jgi:hypothetical membrane protein
LKRDEENVIQAPASFGKVGKPSSDARRAGILLSLSGALFFISNHIAEATYPNYSVRSNYLSDLGATGQPTTLLWNSQLFVGAVLWLLGMYFFLRRGGRSRLTWIPYVAAPIGQMVVSLFPENTVLALHTIGALVAFTMGGISALYAFRLTRPPLGYLSSFLGVTSLASLLLFVSGRYLGLGVGGMERMIVYPVTLWLIALGGYLMAGDAFKQAPV